MLTVNTLVLGMRGYGKTCALSSIYAIMTNGVNRFVLSAKDRSQRVLLNGYWRGMKDGGILPDGTTEGKLFEFICSRSFNPICQVNWYDYPGGWVDTDSEEIEKLEQWMLTADCVICTIPTDELIRAYDTNTYLECMSHYNHLFNDYGVYCRENYGSIKYVPVVFMLTKFDLCKDKEKVKKAIIKYITESAFYDHEYKWLMAVIPVTLGEELRHYKNDQGKLCIDVSTLSPRKIHLPVLFSICKKLSDDLFDKIELMKSKEKDINEIANEIERLENKFFALGKSGKIANWRNRINDNQAELEYLVKNAESIRDQLELVRNELIDGVQLAYYAGSPCDIEDVI